MDKKPTFDPIIQAGTFPIHEDASEQTTSGTAEIAKTVTFPKAFAGDPVVVATVFANHPDDALAVKITGIRPNAFDFKVFRAGKTGHWTAKIAVQWIATDPR